MRLLALAFTLLTILSLFSLITQADSPATVLTKNSADLNETDCLDPLLSEEMLNDFDFTYDESLNLKFDACDSSNIVNQLIRGLAILKYGQYQPTSADASDQEIFLNEFEKVHPYEFVKSRIKAIKFSATCIGPFAAYSHKNWNQFNICVKNIEGNGGSSGIGFAETALHESRHNDTDDVGHFTCTQGDLKNELGSCDANEAQHGAYHYNEEYLIQVGKFSKNIHPAIKNWAFASALYTRLNNFNQPEKPEMKSIAYLKDDKNELYSFGASGLSLLGINLSSSIPFARTEGNLTIYNPTNSFFTGWSPYVGFIEAIGAYAKSYNKKPISERKFIKDIFYSESGSAQGMIEDEVLHYAFYDDNSNVVSEGETSMPDSKSLRFLKADFCKGSEKKFYILFEDRRVFEAGLDNSKKIQFNEVSNCDTRFLNVIDFNKQKIGLTEQGILMTMQNGSWSEMEAFKAQRFSFLSRPFDFVSFFLAK